MFSIRSYFRCLSTFLLAVLFIPLASAKTVYNIWLNEQVNWIITPQERRQFSALTSDPQRDQFVNAFWLRRNPTPGTTENPAKREHYRRLAYTNQRYAEGQNPGWKSDRGRTFIVDGPPDNIEVSPARLDAHQFAESGHRYEIWHYSRGTDHKVTVKFTDVCDCGEFRQDK